jgi:starvation-inducible DNA-binding protein
MHQGVFMDVNIGITKNNAKGVCAILNADVADEVVLYQKTRNFHWNLKGPFFHDLHLLFEEQYGELEEVIDILAERVRQLGGHAAGTLTEYLKLTRLKEHPGKYPSSKEMVVELLHDHETVIRQLRKDLEVCSKKFKDEGSNDIVLGIMEKHEKFAWMLRSLAE